MELSEIIFYTVIILLIFDFVSEQLLSFLNMKQWDKPLPSEVAGLYDDNTFDKAKRYARINDRTDFVKSTISIVLILIVLFFNGLSYLDHLTYNIAGDDSPILSALVFFGIIGVLSAILGLPFSIYSTFVIEQKFGFNKTTPKTFVLDFIKSSALGIILGAAILSLIVKLFLVFTSSFWIFAWLVISLIMLFMTMFYSNLIVPLFNKQTPLEEGELRSAIGDFAQKVGFKLDNIYVIDGSKRSTKANAYFTGLGSKKRIVLYDTLIKDYSSEELVAVLAHEIGHYKHKHTRTSLIIGLLQSAIMLFLLSLFINPEGAIAQATAEAFNTKISFQMGVLIFGILYSPISLIIGITMNYISRRNEYQADAFAAKNASADALSNALVKLTMNNYGNLNPHPAYVFINYSHPPLLFRLKGIKANTLDNN
jgi:STE24 endopeptidase